MGLLDGKEQEQYKVYDHKGMPGGRHKGNARYMNTWVARLQSTKVAQMHEQVDY